MISLKKGNPNSLEGKTLIYVENIRPHCENCKYPAAYISTNPVDVVMFLGLGDKDSFEVKRLTEEFEDIKNRFQKETSHNFPTLGVLVGIKDLNDLSKTHGDVLYGGLVLNKDVAPMVLSSLGHIYTVNYYSQLEIKAKIQSNKTLSTINESYKECKNGLALKSRLHNFVSQLLYSYETTDSRLKLQVESDIRKYTEGALFSDDIINLIGISKTDTMGKNELIQTYIDKICALYDEDFEMTLQFTNKIDSLLKS